MAMAQRFETIEMTTNLASLASTGELQSALDDETARSGLAYFALFSFMPGGPPLALQSDKIGPFLQQYLDERYFQWDPIIQDARNTLKPILWDTAERDRALTKEEHQILDILNGLDMVRGLALPVHGPGGNYNVLCLSTDSPKSTLMELWRERSNYFLLLGNYSTATLHQLAEHHEKAPKLTKRELECLAWTAEGKSSWEISQIIGVSKRTVHFHTQNAMRKLDTYTKYHAVVKAMSLGLIH